MTLKPGKRRSQMESVGERKWKDRNIAERNKQSSNTEDQINKEEIGKLPEKEFRIMIVKMIKNLENRMKKMQE